MSQITRCPSCLTSFQVTQSQLAQASGWVRCGRCDQVFDGATNVLESAADDAPTLQPAPADAGESSTPQAAGFMPTQAMDPVAASADPETPPLSQPLSTNGLGRVSPAAQSSPATADPDPVMARSGLNDMLDRVRPTASGSGVPAEPALDPMDAGPHPLPAAGPASHPDPGDRAGSDPEAHMDAQAGPSLDTPLLPAGEPPHDLPETAEPAPAIPAAGSRADPGPEPAAPGPQSATAAAPETPAPGPAPLPAASGAERPDASAGADDIDIDVAPLRPDAQPPPTGIAAAPAEPSFVAQARRRAFWNHGPVRAGLWLLLLLLCLALAGQWALHERNRLAAQYPRWAPTLDALCQTLDCTVAPYRRLQALAITSSSLKRLDDTAFELDVSLRNRADLAVATPALELTLTDLSERILLRRILEPQELGAPARIAAKDEWRARRALVIDADAGVTGVVNYKLQMFYP